MRAGRRFMSALALRTRPPTGPVQHETSFSSRGATVKRQAGTRPRRHRIGAGRAGGGAMDADNVVNCLDCCGGVGFVVDERFVGWWRWRHGRRVLVDSAAWPYAPSPVAVAS